MTDFSESHPVGIRRPSRLATAWLGIGIALALVGGCTKSDRFAAETAALKTLVEDYKLEKHEKEPKDMMIILKLEGTQFDDNALALVGNFPELQRLCIWKLTVTDAGLEKLPVLKNLTNRTSSPTESPTAASWRFGSSRR